MDSFVSSINVTALPGIPLVQQGDDLPQIILNSLNQLGMVLETGDALVVTSKIVSKSEGRLFDLRNIEPGAEAQRLAGETRKDPRIVELVLRESLKISRQSVGVLVVQHRLGFVSANAGIDQSNVDGSDDMVLLLPLDPDASAERIRERLREATGTDVGIIISDSHGRPFRVGNIGVAIGVAGMPAVLDLRGKTDLFGRELKISIQGYADLVASTANLLTGEADEGRPIVLVRGLRYPAQAGTAKDLYRAPEQDLYR
ncbi:MAG: coenzyme F420-0:L-glutamate ligase [Chloroflexi bacterium]|nr:coenzyme F420-0:L-glutamate ligase [Chloroflexota bacterium]MCC6896408.1 coenzyme F420-0:L-glutamate ligase [Anaerolineae bacterium]